MIKISGISKRYNDFQLTIKELEVGRGDYVVILGDSGSGKSLLLEILAGLRRPDSGSILFENQDILNQSMQERPLGIVFQDLALFPHMTVRQNVAFPLSGKKKEKENDANRINEIVKKMEIGQLLDRYPESLSGGEKQRVALARTLITEPACLLLDEPLSSLDANLKKEVRAMLRWLNRSGQTLLHVTHDYEEAISLASHIGVMHQGELVQYGPAEAVLKEPRSFFVANFTGIRNYFKVVLEAHPATGEMLARTDSGIPIRISTNKTSGQGFVIIPCESLILSKTQVETSAANQFKGIITEISPGRFGIEVSIAADLNLVAQVTQSAVDKLDLQEMAEIWVSFKASSVKFIKK